MRALLAACVAMMAAAQLLGAPPAAETVPAAAPATEEAKAASPAGNLCLVAEQLWQRGYEGSAKAFIGRAARLEDGPVVRFWAGHLCYETGDLAQAVEHFRRAVELAPDSAEAKLYLAAALNAAAKKEEARKLLDELQGAKPPAAVAKSVKEALHRLDDAEQLAWVMVVNPRSPTGSGKPLSTAQPAATLVPAPANAHELTTLSAACTTYPPHAVRLAYLASRLAPDDPTARLAYATALFAYGRGPEAVEHVQAALRLAGSAENPAEVQEAAQRLLASHSELRLEPPDKLVEPGLLVRYQRGDPGVRDLVKALRQARETIHRLLGLEVDEVYVRVFPSRGQFQAYSNARHYQASSEWAGAYAQIGQMGLTTYQQPILPIQQACMAAHEYTHLALYQLTSGRWGVLEWLNEGLARMVEATYTETGARSAVGQAAHRNELLVPAQMSLAFRQSDVVVARLAYAECERLANYLLQTRGEDAVLWLLASLAVSKNESVTFAQIVGCTPDQLFAAWVQAGCP